MTPLQPPAPRPCRSCPYRKDVPSGVWSADEYTKLPRYDGDTAYQDPTVFQCHQQDGRLCAGWVGCHDMIESLGLRFAILAGDIRSEDVDAILDYETDVPLFETGAAAARHGLARIKDPDISARKLAAQLGRKIARTGGSDA